MSRKTTISVRSFTDTLGIERETEHRRSEGMTRLLGWFSLGLGVATLTARPRISRLSGIDDSARAQTVLQIAGVRELGHAAALLVPRRPAWGAWTRVAGDIGDLAACGQGLRHRRGDRRRRLMVATSAVAGISIIDLVTAVRVTRGRPRKNGNRVHASVTVNRSVEDAYRFWHDFQNLPRFMYHLQSVRTTGDGRSRWTAKAPAGREVEWDVEVIEDRPNELIKWRSMPGATVPNSGSVRFVRTAGGHGTEVRVNLEHSVPGGIFGRAVAKIFGEHPQQQVSDDLRRFKQMIETGEIARSDGSPHGVSIREQLMQRPAQPLAMSAGGRGANR
jgi:uncharacterized membrane protein